MDPVIVTNLANALREFYLNAESTLGPGINVYCRQDTLEIATAGVASDINVELARINLVTGEQTILVPPPPPTQVALSIPEELIPALKIGINS
jgi:hypothetical protein